MVELDWVLMNYEVTKNSGKPLVILYGAEDPQLTPDNLPGHVTAVRIKPKYPFGTHHTKVSDMFTLPSFGGQKCYILFSFTNWKNLKG